MTKFTFRAFLSLVIISFANISFSKGKVASTLSTGDYNFSVFTTKKSDASPGWRRINPEFSMHPDALLVPRVSDPSGMVEVLKARTRTTKYFINPANPAEFVQEQSTGEIHYFQNGQWNTIDTRLNPTTGNVFEASHQQEPVGFNIEKKESFIRSENGYIAFNNWALYGKNNSGTQLLSTPNWSDYTVGDDGLYIRNIFPGIDATMVARKGGIKTNFIINTNQFGSYSQLIFKDVFKGPGRGALAFVNGNTAGNTYIGDVSFKSGSKEILRIRKGIAFTKTNNAANVGFRELPYTISGNNLAMHVDAAYINAQLSYGPLVIDPLVETVATLAAASITGSMNCGSITNSCDYILNVTPPSGATITTVQIKFQMLFNAPLTLAQGAFAVSVGTCSTPAIAATGSTLLAPGRVYTPDDSALAVNPAYTQPGFWNAYSATLLPCMPRATCPPPVIPFTLKFWNTYCSGPTGCSNAYVYADPIGFSIRIRGNTFTTTPIVRSSSAASICAGQSITLSRNAPTGGVPPYTYSWSPGGQTTSSITVSPIVSTTYTSTITDSCGAISIDSTRVVVLNADTLPGVVSPLRICQFDNPTPVTATGTNLRWYATATGGSPLPAAPIPNTTVPGTYNYYVTQSNSCGESPRAQLTVIVNPKPAPPGVTTPLRLCQYDTVRLTADGQNVRWYLNPTGGGGQSNFIPPTGGVNDSTIYYATQTVNGCESDRSRLLVTVTYKPNGIISPTRIALCQDELDSFYYYGNARPDAYYNWTSPSPSTAQISGQGTQGPFIVRFDSAGTYNVTVQVNNRGCLSEIATQAVAVRPRPAVFFNTKSDACVDEIINVALSAISPAIDSFNYSFGDGVIRYGAASGGPYGVVFSTPGTRVISNTAYSRGCPSRVTRDTINVHPLADASFTVRSMTGGIGGTVCTGDSIVLRVNDRDSNTRYVWTPDNFFFSGNTFEAVGTIRTTGYIRLDAQSMFGCSSADSVLVKTEACCKVFFPNAFSPNGDTRNDIFRPVSRGSHQVKSFRIMNRWGQVVYESRDELGGWNGTYNGKDQEMGTYYYYLSYRCGDGGGDAPGQQFEEKGEVLLVR